MTTETLRLRSPGELLAVVPYLVGFEPTNSIMVICLQDSRIGLTQRLDLPPAGQGDAAVASLMPSLLHERPDQVLLIAYESRPDRSAEMVDALTPALTAAGSRSTTGSSCGTAGGVPWTAMSPRAAHPEGNQCPHRRTCPS